MKVRIKTGLVYGGRVLQPGSKVNVDDEIAKQMIASGYAEEDKSLEGPSEVKKNVAGKKNSSK
jgi:hypothetical protein